MFLFSIILMILIQGVPGSIIHVLRAASGSPPAVLGDDEPPIMVADNTPSTGTTGDLFEFSVNITDNVGIVLTYVNFTFDDSLYYNITMIYAGGDNWNKMTTISSSARFVHYIFFAWDAAGNMNTTQIKTITIIDNDVPYFDYELSEGTPTTGDEYTVIMGCSDNVDDMNEMDVSLWYAFNGVPSYFTNMIYSDGNFTKTITIAHDATYIDYAFNISDSSGNWYLKVMDYVFVLDNDPPVWGGDATGGNPVAGRPFNVSAIFYDNTDLDNAYVNYSFYGMGFMNAALHHTVGNYWNDTINIPPNCSTFVYWFYAVDESGNAIDTYGEMVSGHGSIEVEDIDDPFAHSGSDKIINQGMNIKFNGSLSYDNVTEYLKYTWTFVYDGVDMTLYGEVLSFTFEIAGEYLIFLNVSDEAGNWDVDNLTITVRDITLPMANAGADQTADPHTQVFFNGGDSTDNVGIANYTWEFSHGNRDIFLYGEVAFFTFYISGAYNITLTVTDASGNEHSDHLILTVLDGTPPIANAGNDQSKNEGSKVVINGGLSSDDVSIVNYTWTFKYDGKKKELYGITTTFTFELVGIYEVMLTVKDSGGNTDSDMITITIIDATLPVASVNASKFKVGVGKDVKFTGKESTDNIGIVNYTWTIEGGAEDVVLSGEETNFTFTKPGTYTITLTVTDAAGNEDETTFDVQVMKWVPGDDDDMADDDDNDDRESDDGEGQDGMSTGSILTISFGIIAVILIVMALIFMILRKKPKEWAEKELEETEYNGGRVDMQEIPRIRKSRDYESKR